jgi:hypothetical protein
MKSRPETAIASFQTMVEDLARAAAGEVVVVTGNKVTGVTRWGDGDACEMSPVTCR